MLYGHTPYHKCALILLRTFLGFPGSLVSTIEQDLVNKRVRQVKRNTTEEPRQTDKTGKLNGRKPPAIVPPKPEYRNGTPQEFLSVWSSVISVFNRIMFTKVLPSFIICVLSIQFLKHFLAYLLDFISTNG
jgi:hypothetical protein